MYKKIAAFLATLAAVAGLTFMGAPAYANFAQGTCVANTANVDLTVVNLGSDQFRMDVTGHLADGQGRTWDWSLRHNGNLSDSGNNVTGSFSVERSMINFDGVDTVKFIADNNARTVHCVVTINYAGGHG